MRVFQGVAYVPAGGVKMIQEFVYSAQKNKRIITKKQGRFHMSEAKKFYAQAYNRKSKEDVAKLYGEWADTYDSELQEYNYVAPEIGAKVFCDYLKNSNADLVKTKIIDIGCGTGLVGHFLAELGCENVDGLDLSAEMLAQAQKRGVYKDLFQVDMTLPQQIADETYDAAISVGMFTHHHVGPNGLDKVLAMIKPGGIASITVNADAYVKDGYRAKFDDLVVSGACKILEERQADYIVEQEVHSRIVVLQKT